MEDNRHTQIYIYIYIFFQGTFQDPNSRPKFYRNASFLFCLFLFRFPEVFWISAPCVRNSASESLAPHPYINNSRLQIHILKNPCPVESLMLKLIYPGKSLSLKKQF